jgi:hypothetical protein
MSLSAAHSRDAEAVNCVISVSIEVRKSIYRIVLI